MTTKLDWDSLERWVNDLAHRIKVAKRAEAKLISHGQGRATHNTYDPNHAEAEAENGPDLESEREISPEGLRNLLDSIIKEARTIQKKFQDALRPTQPHSKNPTVDGDGSALEEQPPQPPQAQQAQQLENSSLEVGVNDGQQTPQPCRSLRERPTQTSKSVTVVEAGRATSTTKRRSQAANSVNSSCPIVPITNSSPAQSQLQTPLDPMQLTPDLMQEKFVQTLQERHHQERCPYAKYNMVDLNTPQLS
jgi:hypothetical protein